jgi:excisionase family DNA binding protein
MVMADEEVLTVPEVAKRLRLSEYSVRNYLRAGRLRGYRPGGTRAGWRIPMSELQRFIAEAQGREEPQPC